MDCFNATINMQLFLDGELPDPEHESLQAHYSACPACEQKLNSEKKFKETLAEKLERKTACDSVLEMVKSVLLQKA